MDRDRAKKILKVAIFLYIASFLIINWSDVSWIFNYREVSGLISDFFNPYPSINASAMDVYFYPNHSPSQTLPKQNLTVQGQEIVKTAVKPEAIKNVRTNYTEKQNILEIPKIGISVPIIFSKNADIPSLEKDLDSGVTYYPGSVYPGQQGQIIILGHSAPPGWPKIKHDWVFTDLNKLNPGDNVMINLNNKQYTYIVREKHIIKRGADVPAGNFSANSNVLTLISCWPPGKDYQRIAVISELQSD